MLEHRVDPRVVRRPPDEVADAVANTTPTPRSRRTARRSCEPFCDRNQPLGRQLHRELGAHEVVGRESHACQPLLVAEERVRQQGEVPSVPLTKCSPGTSGSESAECSETTTHPFEIASSARTHSK